MTRSYIYIYTHTFPFLYYLPSWSIPRDWIYFPVLHSRTSLLIHSKWNRLYLLTPNSQSISLPPPTPWQPQVCPPYLCVCFYSVDRFICAIFYLFIIYLFCLLRFAPTAYGGSRVRGLISAVATGLRHSHSHAKSELHLQPTPQLMATQDP